MKKQVLTILFFGAFFWILQACAPKAQEDCGYVQNSSGQRVSWKGRLPVNFYLHESVPPRFYPAITAAMSQWESAAGRKLFRIVGTSYRDSDAPRIDNVNVIYWRSTWEKDRKSEQARTSVHYEGNELRESDIIINAQNFSYYIDSPQNPREVHLESLVQHELGHVLGLKHRDHEGSVMATVLSAGTARTKLSSNDLSSLQCEY